MRTTYILLIAVIFLGLVLAGCPSQQETAQTETERAATAETTQVDAALGEWYVRLNPSIVKAGNVRFNVRNEGENRHFLEIEGQGIEEKSRTLNAGETTTMTVNLPAGTYEAYCPIGNHTERGMHTELVVEAR